MRAIYKYPLPLRDDIAVDMPKGAVVRSVDTQDGMNIWVWAEVDPEEMTTETRRFYVRGTGHLLPEHAEYLSTVICAGGALIWHVFADVTP